MCPTLTEKRPNTGEDPEQVSRKETPSEGDPSPSTKPGLPPPLVTEAPGEREDQTRGTNGSSNATAESAFEDAREVPASPAMTGAPTAPATAERGEPPQ